MNVRGRETPEALRRRQIRNFFRFRERRGVIYSFGDQLWKRALQHVERAGRRYDHHHDEWPKIFEAPLLLRLESGPRRRVGSSLIRRLPPEFVGLPFLRALLLRLGGLGLFSADRVVSP